MRRNVLATSALAVSFLLVAAAPGADTTVRVDEDLEAGWAFNPDASTSSPYVFSLDESAIGTGSIYVEPIANDSNGGTHQGRLDKFIAEQVIGIPTADLNTISYSFLIAGAGSDSDAKHFYLNLYTNLPTSDPENFYNCRFDYVPTTGSTSEFTSVTFEAGDSPTHVQPRGVSSSSCPATLAEMPAGSWLRAFTLNVGDTSESDTGLAGYLDNVVVAAAAGTTTYDFEVLPADKGACKRGGWADYGFANQGHCASAVQSNAKAGK